MVTLPGIGVWHTSQANRCRPSSSASRVGALTCTVVGASPYTVDPVSVEDGAEQHLLGEFSEQRLGQEGAVVWADVQAP